MSSCVSKGFFYPMGQAVYQKKISTDLTSCVTKIFFSQQMWQAVYQKYFFLNRCDKLCIKRGDGVPFLLVSREAAARALSAALYLFFTCSSYFFTIFFCLSWSRQWLIIKIICDHHVHDYQWLSAWYRLERLSLNQRRILGTNFPIWDHPPLWGYWGYWWYWEPTFQFGIIILFEDIEDIGNQLLNFGSSTPLRILRITRILRILRTLGTNFPILDHSPHWGPPSWWTHLQHEVYPSYQLNEDIIHLYFRSKRHRRHGDIIVCPLHSLFSFSFVILRWEKW